MTYNCVNCGKEVFAGFSHECSENRKNSTSNNGGSTDYYQLPATAKEMQDLIEYRNMNFAQGNMFKALYRCNADSNTHSSYERDLNKIVWYAQRELQRLRNDVPSKGK